MALPPLPLQKGGDQWGFPDEVKKEAQHFVILFALYHSIIIVFASR